MDEKMLNDLLECSVCLDRLDTTSKVLPCQHTFCRMCLEEIISTHGVLRCPECRILVKTPIDDLPPNVLLMRILEGMKNSGNPITKENTRMCKELVNQSSHQGSLQSPDLKVVKEEAPTQYVRALYDYLSNDPGDLNFKKGDIITLHTKVNDHWFRGECKGKSGIFPSSYVQAGSLTHIAKCKALYDFQRTDDDGCLTFAKDDVITVLKRVDENWAEGKLNDRVGIFPLSFVEMNSIARTLVKLSINSQPGPSRVAPPIPVMVDSTPLIPLDNSSAVSNVGAHGRSQNSTATAPENVLPNMNYRIAKPISKTTVVNPTVGTGPSSTMSSSTSTKPSLASVTPNSSSSTSSNANSTPNSPSTNNQHPYNSNPFLPASQTSRHMILQTSHITNASHSVLPTSHITAQYSLLSSKTHGNAQTHGHRQTSSSAEESIPLPTHSKEKRHSFTASTPTHQAISNGNRHSAEIISMELPMDRQDGQLNRRGSQRHKRCGSDLPVRTNLPAESLIGNQPRVGPTREAPAIPSLEHKDSHQIKSPKLNQFLKYFPHTSLTPPELPPRASSPPSRHMRASASASQASANAWIPQQSDVASSNQKATFDKSLKAPLVGNSLLSSPESSRNPPSTYVSPPPNVSICTPSKAVEKMKEKKEKSGLMKRLKEKTGIRRSKSPLASTSYSIDNPVFDDTPASPFHSRSQSHSVHMRSGSCPNQLIQIEQERSSQRVFSASVSARIKYRERPSISNANFTHTTSRHSDGSGGWRGRSGSGHRKSNSLDAGDSRKRHLVPTVRERFRCIVPYPPNTEYELELQIGDVIYVHRKRDDGWYKGTQQRTGRTGLFPSSFVESY